MTKRQIIIGSPQWKRRLALLLNRYVEARKRMGACVNLHCTNPAAPDRVKCPSCLDTADRARAKFIKQRKERGICVRCRNELAPDATTIHCETCRKDNITKSNFHRQFRAHLQRKEEQELNIKYQLIGICGTCTKRLNDLIWVGSGLIGTECPLCKDKLGRSHRFRKRRGYICDKLCKNHQGDYKAYIDRDDAITCASNQYEPTRD